MKDEGLVPEVERVAEGLRLRCVELGSFLASDNLAAEEFFKVGGEVEALRAARAAHVEFYGSVWGDGDFDFLDFHKLDWS
jgi:hypothetical protein